MVCHNFSTNYLGEVDFGGRVHKSSRVRVLFFGENRSGGFSHHLPQPNARFDRNSQRYCSLALRHCCWKNLITFVSEIMAQLWTSSVCHKFPCFYLLLILIRIFFTMVPFFQLTYVAHTWNMLNNSSIFANAASFS